MLRQLLRVFAIVVAGVVVTSCGSRGVATPSPTLFDSTWRLVLIEGDKPLEDVRVTVTFSRERVSGSSGCNSYSGSVTIRGDRVDFGLLASTQMYCTSDGVMSQEERFFAALGKTRGFLVTGNELRLFAADGSVLLVFRIEER